MASRVDMSELGRSGLRQWGGYVYEEFLKELYGIYGIRTYKEMSENDPVVGAFLFAIEMILRQVSWTVDPASADNADQEAAEFVESCLSDMSQTWADTISEILTMLPYGWSYHEIVYKRRLGNSSDPTKNSKYNDGRIGWRKLPLRAQDTLLRWQFDENDGLQGMVQSSPPDYQTTFIPIDKALLFRTRTNKGNPEGRSILRTAYRPWYFKKRIEVIEGIGIERDLAGFPVIKPRDGIDLNTVPDIFDTEDPDMVRLRNELQRIVRNIRRDEMEGAVLGGVWDIALVNSGGSRQIDVGKVIDRYDQRIAMSVLADFILLGSQQVGSFALATSKSEIFMQAMNTFLDMVCEVFNRYAIPRLMALNAGFPQEELPQLRHGQVEHVNLQELGQFIKDTSGSGFFTPGDPATEDALRRKAGLPLLPDEE